MFYSSIRSKGKKACNQSAKNSWTYDIWIISAEETRNYYWNKYDTALKYLIMSTCIVIVK